MRHKLKPQPHPTDPDREMPIELFIGGMRLVNATNEHTHWRVRAKRAKEQRSIAQMVCRTSGLPPEPPLRITITRIAPSRGLDSDSLPPSGKHARDGIADWLGVDDGDNRLEWAYEQERGDWGVRIRIERAA